MAAAISPSSKFHLACNTKAVMPPGNRLEELKGNRRGQYSMRINDQFRICFRWTDAGARDVEIVDYHS